MYNDKQTTCLHAHGNTWLGIIAKYLRIALYMLPDLQKRILYVQL